MLRGAVPLSRVCFRPSTIDRRPRAGMLRLEWSSFPPGRASCEGTIRSAKSLAGETLGSRAGRIEHRGVGSHLGRSPSYPPPPPLMGVRMKDRPRGYSAAASRIPGEVSTVDPRRIALPRGQIDFRNPVHRHLAFGRKVPPPPPPPPPKRCSIFGAELAPRMCMMQRSLLVCSEWGRDSSSRRCDVRSSWGG